MSDRNGVIFEVKQGEFRLAVGSGEQKLAGGV
jgi:hypothetical protein